MIKNPKHSENISMILFGTFEFLRLGFISCFDIQISDLREQRFSICSAKPLTIPNFIPGGKL